MKRSNKLGNVDFKRREHAGKIGTVEARLTVALAAYLIYVINAAQFLLKLRAARLQAQAAADPRAGAAR